MIPPSQVVHVVDDDEAVLDAMRLLFRSVGLPCRGYGSATEFLEAFDPDQPGCLVLDVRMPGVSGLDLQRELLRRGTVIPIIFVTAHGDVPMAVDAMKAGAADFLQKPFRDQDLLTKVQQALARDTEYRAEASAHREAQAHLATLTPREHEIMERVVAGQANKVIASELGISQRTVEVHRARVMEKMGVDSVADLVRKALQAKEASPS